MLEDLTEAHVDSGPHQVLFSQQQNKDPLYTLQATQTKLLALQQPERVERVASNGTTAVKNEPFSQTVGGQHTDEVYAIVGMSCRIPGAANSANAFWDLLRAGREVIDDVPDDRWDVDAFYDPDIEQANKTNKMYTRRAGFLPGMYHFDAGFFQISPREAQGMDPQHRILLETTWEAIEHAGIAPSSLEGSRTGVYMGIASNFHEMLLLGSKNGETINPFSVVGGTSSAGSGRISFLLGLQGPAISVDTACSSSLTALHLACQSLGLNETDMAIVGGANAILSPSGIIARCQSRMMSPQGRCHSFDEAANGYVPSEACGVIVVKRLSDAQRDGDRVLAVVRSIAANQDGRSTGGMMVPSGKAQEAVIRTALSTAGLSAEDIQYVEAHGTGTPVGDPIELHALQAVYGEREQPLLVGSVKANVGHSESAAGVVSIIKTVLSLQNQEVAPHPHLETPTSAFDWDSGSIEVPVTPTPWPETSGLRRGGVNSFGISGTNVHVILEEAPPVPAVPANNEPGAFLLPISAKSESALQQSAERFSHYLQSVAPQDFADVCATAAQGRTHFSHRIALVAQSPEDAHVQLRAFLNGDSTHAIQGIVPTGTAPPKIAFLFTGQGSQYPGMGGDLYEREPVFRDALNRCAAIAAPHLDHPLLDVIFDNIDSMEGLIHQTAYTQPALFAVEYALATLWHSWGITPDAVLGHSIGEYAAACIAGVFSLEDALYLVIERGRLMQSLPLNEGSMAAVSASVSVVGEAISAYGDTISIAGMNGPESIVISGDANAITALCKQLEADGIDTTFLEVSHAFHSVKMDPILEAFQDIASKVTFIEPQIPLMSNVTGLPIKPGEITNPAYWAQHIRQPVRFQAGIKALQDLGIRVFLEAGPKPTLIGMGRMCLPSLNAAWISSLRQKQPGHLTLLNGLGELYTQGVSVAWASVMSLRQRKELPTYPFQPKNFQPEGIQGDLNSMISRFMPGSSNGHPLIGELLSSPLLPGPVFEAHLSNTNPSFLSDHRIYEVPVLPGTGYLEMVMAAARKALGERPYEIERATVKHVMAFPQDVVRTVQIALTPQEKERYAFTIFSREEQGQGDWVEHIIGSLRTLQSPPPPPRLTLEQETNTHEEIDMEGAYERIGEVGTGLTGYFRNIERAFGTMDIENMAGSAIAYIKLPIEGDPSISTFSLHPAMLDGCLQVMCFPVPTEDTQGTLLPTGIGGYRLYRTGCTEAWCVTSIQSNDDNWDSVTGEIHVYDTEGHLVAHVESLHLQRASLSAVRRLIQPPLHEWLCEVVWLPETPISDFIPPAGRWLLFADTGEVATTLAESLRRTNASCTLVYAGPETKRVDDTTWTLSPGDAEGMQHLLREVSSVEGVPLSGIVFLWTLDMPAPNTTTSLKDQESVLGCFLHVLQTFVDQVKRIILVTQEGSPYPDPTVKTQSLAQTTSWGMRRTFATEHPEVRSLAIDIPASLAPIAAATIIREEMGRQSEFEVTYREGKRFVPRLRKRPKREHWPWSDGSPYMLHPLQRGDLDQLSLQPYRPPTLERNEVEIHVSATGLNFRDVLNALGMYPGDPGPLGAECAGRVVAVGEGVAHVAVGDEVIALANGSFSSSVTVPSPFVFRKPRGISLAEGATLPITFLTVYYGFHHIASLKPGQRVLIHAAAGGVGSAAVQLALQTGAEVYGTAGSPEKRDRVREMGVAHVMDSRSVDFADEIERLTDGEGVDLVLNALTGPFIPAGLRILKEGGYFLELGKREIWTQEQVDAIKPGLNYVPYDLGDVMQDEHMTILEMLQAIVESIEAGELAPLPVTAFSIQEAKQAFRYMAQARHIGKVVVTHPAQANVGAPLFHAEATYLITGGLGGLGLRLAERLVERGARHLVLIGRSAPSEAAQTTLDALRSQDVVVHVASVDVSDAKAVHDLIADIKSNMPPLRGIFHAAGVIRDAVILMQDWANVEKVLAPKVAGGWNLHEATRDITLDYFVLYSSIAAILGTVGQCAYVGANLFLDRLAAFRRTQGLPAISINWGPWDEVGMMLQLTDRELAQLSQNTGLDLIPVDRGFDAQEMLLRDALLGMHPDAVAVGPFTWSNVIIPEWRKHMLKEVASFVTLEQQAKPTKDLGQQIVQQIQDAKPEDRLQLVLDDLRQRIARVARMDITDVPTESSLMTIGLESLMAIEFKSQVEIIYNMDLSTALLLRGASLRDLAAHVLESSFRAKEEVEESPSSDINLTDEPAELEDSSATDTSPTELLARLDELSESEMDTLLNELENDTP